MGVDLSRGHEAMDYSEHQRTYSLFIKGTVYLAAICLVTLALLGIFVA